MRRVIELEQGVWLADGVGDPSRTLRVENALVFPSRDKVTRALRRARRYHPFINAAIRKAPAK